MAGHNQHNTVVCHQCEVEYPPNTNFCTLCGSRLEQKPHKSIKKKKKGFFGEIENIIDSTAESLDKTTSTGNHQSKSSRKRTLKISRNTCPNCKATLQPNINFCTYCGTKLPNPKQHSPKEPTPQYSNKEKVPDNDFLLLEKLADLHNKGILTTTEFNEQKRRILNI